MKGGLAAALVWAAIGAVALGGCGSGRTVAEPPEPNALVYLRALPGRSIVLIDSQDRTLYQFSKDTQGGGETHCYGACARVWLPKLTVDQPHGESRAFHPGNFGTIERRDGSHQATYMGWPLYTYGGEKADELEDLRARSFGGSWRAMRLSGGSVR